MLGRSFGRASALVLFLCACSSPYAARDLKSEPSSGGGGGGGEKPAAPDPPATGAKSTAPFTCNGSTSRYCADFEDGAFPAEWDFSTEGGQPKIVSDEQRGGFVLEATTVAGKECLIGIEKSVDVMGGAMKLEFDMRMTYGKVPTNGAIWTFSIALASNNNGLATYGATADGEVALASPGQLDVGTFAPAAASAPVDEWTHVVMEVTFGSPSGSIKVSFDGRLVVDGHPLTTSPTSGPPARVAPWFGAQSTGGAISTLPVARVRYDNIRID